MKFTGLIHWKDCSAAEFDNAICGASRFNKTSLLGRIRFREADGFDTTEERKGLTALREHEESFPTNRELST